MNIFDDISKVDVPVLADGQLYIYVLENYPQKNIKIGQSTNMQQRLRALSGSNSGGNYITKIAISDATYLYTLERIAHQHFHQYRINGTEWFDGVTFQDVVAYLDSLFASSEYRLCNGVRKNFWDKYHERTMIQVESQ